MKYSSRLFRRLAPLFIAMGLQNFVLWYATEKLFMTTIGFDNTTIALMASVYAATMLVFETPSGLLADRWSRKGVLIIAGVALALSSLIGGLSNNVFDYIIAAISWGTYFALYSGTYDAIIYDTLVEETGNGDKYETYSGRMHALGGIFLVAGSLLGGLIGAFIDLRAPYFITVPIALLSIVALLILKEPTLHKKQEYTSIRSQVASTFRAISKKGVVLWLSITTIIVMLIDQMIFEFNQLWLIALAAPVVLFGPANGLLLLSITVGGFSAKYLSNKRRLIIGLLVLVLVAALCLALVKEVWVVIIASFVIGAILITYEIVFDKLLHDQISSSLRAGAMSAISSVSKLLFIPVSLSFGVLSQTSSVFSASWIIVGLVILLAVVMLVTLAKIHRPADSNVRELVYDEPRK